MTKNNFDRSIGPKEAPRLTEYNFNIDVAAIVSAIERIKETKWPDLYNPIQIKGIPTICTNIMELTVIERKIIDN